MVVVGILALVWGCTGTGYAYINITYSNCHLKGGAAVNSETETALMIL